MSEEAFNSYCRSNCLRDNSGEWMREEITFVETFSFSHFQDFSVDAQVEHKRTEVALIVAVVLQSQRITQRDCWNEESIKGMTA